MSSARFLASLALALPAALILVSTAQATTALSRLDVPELTGLSDVVVHGFIRSIDPYLEGGDIYTRVEVQVETRLKGQPEEPGGEDTILRLLGGTYDGRRTFVVGGPCIAEGEEVVLFLTQSGIDENDTPVYDVVSLSEGKFSVDRNTSFEPQVVRDLQGIHYIAPDASDIPQFLDELEASVRTAVQPENR